MSAAAKIVGGVGAIAVGVLLIGTPFGMPLILGGITTAAGGIAEALMPPPRLGAGGARGVDLNIQQTIPPELIVYGKTPIPGTPVWIARHSITQSGPDTEFSHWIYVHTRRRPLNQLLGLIIAGKYYDLVANGTTNDFFPPDALIPDGGKFAKNIGVFPKRGADDDPPFTWLASVKPNMWTSDHKLTKIAATFVSYIFDAQIMPNGPPNIQFVWEGFLVNDPRNPTAPPAYTENAALCLADALYGPHAGSGAIDPSLIDEPELIAAANSCDEQLTTKTGDVIARYRVGGFADATNDYDQTIKDLLLAFAGSLVKVGASYKIYAGVPRAVEVDLSSEDYVAGVNVQILRDPNTLFNEIHTLYPDERVEYNDNQSPTFPIFQEYYSGGGGGDDVWPLNGLFGMGAPDINEFWTGHKNSGNNSTFAQLTDGVSMKGGTMGDSDENGLAFFSRTHLDGDFEVAFTTVRTSNRIPPSAQDRFCLRFFMQTQGDSTHPFYMSMFDVATKPNVNVYAGAAKGVFFRMYNMTPSDTNNTDPAYASMIDGSGSITACSISGPSDEIDYSQWNVIKWNFKRVGDDITVSVVSDRQAAISWTIDATGAPTRGAFGFQCDPGLGVSITAFRVIGGTVVTPGGLISFPGSWPSTSITYAFPGSGFTGWRATTDDTITTPLSATFTPAPTGMKDGFRAAFAQIAADTGFTFTEVAASSAQILIAVSPGLAALGFNGYTFRPPSGALFIDDAQSTGDFSSGTYLFQVCLHEISHAVGIVHPPLNSIIDDYTVTIMVRNSVNLAPWATGLHQMDKDAYKIQYNQAVSISAPDAASIGGPSFLGGTNPYREEDNGQQLVRELRQPFCPYTNQVQRVQKIVFLQHRSQLTWSCEFSLPKAWMTHPMMVVTVTDDLMGWDHEKFQIGRFKGKDGSIELAFAGYDDAMFAWSAVEEQLENYDTTSGQLLLLDDDYTIEQDNVLTANPLDNDEEADLLTISNIDDPGNGTIEISDDGRTITYTPNTGWTGIEVLTYTATDGSDDGTATITIHVIADNVASAVDDFVRVAVATAVNCNVLDNDHPTASAKTVTAITQPSFGVSTILSDSSDVTYKANKGYNGFDSFTYTMTCAEGTDTASVTLSVGKRVQGNNPSGLAWASGMCDTGDYNSAASDGDTWATWRGRSLDIVNFRMTRFGTLADCLSYATSHASAYADAYTRGIRVEQVVPMVPSGQSHSGYSSIFAAAAAGAYDSDHQAIANKIFSYDRVDDTIIRLGHEARSTSQTDSFLHDTSAGYIDYRKGYNRIAKIYKSKGFIIDWNHIQAGADITPAYPGDDAVDIIGADCYGNNNSGFPTNQTEFLRYANKTAANGSPQGPRAWALYAQKLGKKVGYAEWAVTHLPEYGSKADNPVYIEGMWNIYNEFAGVVEYECYFNGATRHFLHNHTIINPNAATKYAALWTP